MTTTASSSIPIPIAANETRQLVSCARAVATGRPRTVAAVPPPVTSASPRPSCAPDSSEEAYTMTIAQNTPCAMAATTRVAKANS